MSNLKEKAIHGVSWSAIDSVTNSGITFLVGIILARILSPVEFGILGMIIVFIEVSNSIVDSGFSSALIRKVETKRIDYNTVFYFNLCLGVILYVILFFCAPAISRFFNEPILISVTRVMGVILVINSLGIVQRTLLVREVDFKTQAKISLTASVLSGLIGVITALNGFGVWSLVTQQISRQFFNTVLLWVLNNWRPAWEFSKQSFQELFGFGSKLLISSLIDTIYRNIYYLIIGKFYTAVQLGYYTRAEEFNKVFSNNLTTVIQRVSYPIFCSIQDDAERLRQTYKRVIKSTMIVAFSCMLGLAAVAKSLVLILIGVKWLPAVGFLQIICLAGMFYPLHAINLNMLMVKGRSDLFLKLEIIKKFLAVLPIVLGIFYGIEVMLWGSVIVSFASYFVNSFYSEMLVNYSTWSQIKDISPGLLVSFIVAFTMWSITLLNYSEWITFTLQCALGIILFIGIHETIKLTEYNEIKGVFKSIIKKNLNYKM